MDLLSFRIVDFRSVKDSGWCEFSPDGVTVLVGQNESGKSSLLKGLSFAGRYSARIAKSDVRFDAESMRVSVRARLSDDEVSYLLDGRSETFSRLAKDALERSNLEIELTTEFDLKGSEEKPAFVLDRPGVLPGMSDELRSSLSEEDTLSRGILEKDSETFLEELVDIVPVFSLFVEEESAIPDSILLDAPAIEKGSLKGSIGAKNLLSAAGLKVGALLSADDRLRATMLRRANESLKIELDKYWSQYLGENRKIVIEIDYGRYPAEHESTPGSVYLTFWVSEGLERFYPSQRSRGTRWFVSLFLHLLATEKNAKSRRVVMLDEPGSFLHAKAQDDVRRLIERVSQKYPVVYSTHSPELVDFDKPFRIRAVERSGDGPLADTQVLQALKLSSASRETLSPILQRMGADLRHQTVIRHKGNVLLEEPSAHLYLRAFEKILYPGGSGLSYIAASGVNNVPVMFSLMLAWGLGFVVLLDDDKQAREVRKQLIKNYFGDKAELSANQIFRLEGKAGVEDCFESSDFHKLVVKDGSAPRAGVANSAYAKEARLNKAILAHRFFVAIDSGEISERDLSKDTLDYFSNLIEKLRVACGV